MNTQCHVAQLDVRKAFDHVDDTAALRAHEGEVREMPLVRSFGTDVVAERSTCMARIDFVEERETAERGPTREPWRARYSFAVNMERVV